jgi:hypothetical protein
MKTARVRSLPEAGGDPRGSDAGQVWKPSQSLNEDHHVLKQKQIRRRCVVFFAMSLITYKHHMHLQQQQQQRTHQHTHIHTHTYTHTYTHKYTTHTSATPRTIMFCFIFDAQRVRVSYRGESASCAPHLIGSSLGSTLVWRHTCCAPRLFLSTLDAPHVFGSTRLTHHT